MVLTEDDKLSDPLWVDGDDARARLAERLAQGQLTPQEAAAVQYFIEHGYVVLDLPDVEGDIAETLGDVERAWAEAPTGLLAAGPIRGGRPYPMSFLAKELTRGPGVRILDLHSHSAGARKFYLNDTLHRFAEIVFGQPAVATQTIYFEYGSTQSLHRDPWFVNHDPRTHLLAAWIALEDIHPDSGPLTLVPGSNRLPFYRFSTDDVVFHDRRVSPVEHQAARDHMAAQMSTLETAPFLGKRGQALIWHGSLIHGGSHVRNESLTRKSLVVHFGCEATHPRRGGGFGTSSGEGGVRYTTEKYVSPTGRSGFHSPVAGLTEADI